MIWKKVHDYRGYEVSDTGLVRSYLMYGHNKGKFSRQPHFLRPVRCSGYPSVMLHNHNGHKISTVHSLVLEAFLGPRPTGMECCHNDGNRTNNRLSNLRWDTRKANEKDKVRHGRSCRGERHAHASLSNAKVKRIASALDRGESQTKIRQKYGVSKVVASSIKTGRTWGWLTGRSLI